MLHIEVHVDGDWKPLGAARPLYKHQRGGGRRCYAVQCDDVDVVVTGVVAGRKKRHVLPLVLIKSGGNKWINNFQRKEKYRVTNTPARE